MFCYYMDNSHPCGYVLTFYMSSMRKRNYLATTQNMHVCNLRNQAKSANFSCCKHCR
uniref:Uncharacterized protein n=1 Tax=Anguilla anguilla TaxID=7936 RepID=A0A0E9VHT3_ANGAN